MRGACAMRRGFSLLEVAIALAILVAISAMVIPAVGPRLDLQAGIEARARIGTAVARAQAEASTSGRPLRVLVVGSEPERLVSEPLMPSATELDAPEPDLAQTILVVLPQSCRVVVGSGDRELDEPEAFGAPVSGPEPERLIGWVLPDGTFEPAGEIRLELPSGQEPVAISSWTGRVGAASVQEEAG